MPDPNEIIPIKVLAKKALEVQYACNMGGIANSFQEAVMAIWKHAHNEGYGTTWVNQHPVVRAYAMKIADLSGTDPLDIKIIEVLEKITQE